LNAEKEQIESVRNYAVKKMESTGPNASQDTQEIQGMFGNTQSSRMHNVED